MKAFAITLLFAAVAFAQAPFYFSGKWSIQGAGGRGGGRGGPQTLTLNQVGADVSGELGGGGGGGGSAAPINNEIWDGKVAGDTISFYIWRGSDKPVKTFYRGQLNAAGDEITFTVTGGPQGRGGDGRGGRRVTAGTGSCDCQEEPVAGSSQPTRKDQDSPRQQEEEQRERADQKRGQVGSFVPSPPSFAPAPGRKHRPRRAEPTGLDLHSPIS
jgi:hypothetical protein